ncbi:MAG: hypothetical protein O9296_15080, partial [Novosphingobium sp.]|nr:hypothetical protein [Novosphingobium sp.]
MGNSRNWGRRSQSTPTARLPRNDVPVAVQRRALGGLATWRTFTADGELDVMMVEDGGTDIIRRTLTRTDNLNITNIWDDVTPARNQSFWYDARNQLQNASGPWRDLTYYYDLVGNRTYAIQTPAGGGATTTHASITRRPPTGSRPSRSARRRARRFAPSPMTAPATSPRTSVRAPAPTT